MSILELLGRREQPLSLAEIAAELDLPKSSALSLLRALTQREFATTDQRGHYLLACRSFEVGAAYLRSMTPVRAVRDELPLLTGALGVTSHFAILDGAEVLYLAKQDPPGPALTLASSLGARIPARTTAVGKAQLAHQPPGPGDGYGPELLPEPRSRLTAAAAARELEEVRRAGYAVDEGETAPGVRCVAAPVFASDGCCGAIGVSYLLQAGPDLARAARSVTAAAARASARLGGRAHLERTP
jgi:DNA-binding IclR family transcriptional regulator